MKAETSDAEARPERPGQAQSLFEQAGAKTATEENTDTTDPEGPATDEPAASDATPNKPPETPAAAEPAPESAVGTGDAAAAEPAAPSPSRPNRKLDDESVHHIRANYDGTPATSKNLAALHNVSPQTVRLVALRKRWKQVPAREGEWKP